MDAKFFKTPADFRKWLEKNHARADELWVGFHKKGSGKPSITWPESVDAALCYGWIDGLRKSIDENSYRIRFTPRRRNSIWSAVNLKRVLELTKRGLMKPAGLKVFEQRNKSKVYSYEQRNESALDPAYRKRLDADPKASAFFNSQAPWYRKTIVFWIMSAKQEATRQRRFEQLIEACHQGRRLGEIGSKNQAK